MQTYLDFILKKISPLKSQFKNKSILVTGASGFIGKWIILLLLELNTKYNYEIKIYFLTRNKKKFLKLNKEFNKSNQIIFIENNILNLDIKKYDFNFIFHLAGDLNKKNHNKLLQYDEIVTGSKIVFDYSKINNKVKILFLSSGAVYGNFEKKIYHKNSDTVDFNKVLHNTYAYGKLSAENYAKFLHSFNKSKIKIARCFTLVGPYQMIGKGFAIVDFISLAIKDKNIKINSPLKVYRSYMFVADLIIWLIFILLKGEDGKVYNVGSDKPILLLDLAKKIVKLTNSKSKVIPNRKSLNNEKIQFYIPDIEETKKTFNLDLWTDIDQSIISMVNSIK